jgi:nitrogen fixation/metabolism regulation signal transduction histidine kinase
MEPVGKEGLYSRVAVSLKSSVGRETLILTALFPFSEKEQQLADNVQTTYNQYQEVNFLRSQIKNSFRYTLLLIMLLSILFAVWAAFIYSQRLTEPVRTLLEGTLAVASGNLQKKLPVAEKDDFSLLARSFNTMTARLSAARRESEESQQRMKRQHDYLNIVLDNLTSGVITVDEKLLIRRINTIAVQILGMPPQQYTGKTLKEICQSFEALRPFYETVIRCLQEDTGHHVSSQENEEKEEADSLVKGVATTGNEWQSEINLFIEGQRRTLMCRGAKLPALLDGSQGYVLVVDDISEMIQAEHDAAWSEVARRLAHEIKNPLTPIQLSAERLLSRLKPKLDDDSADLLQRMSNTIVNQVDTMKKMVNAFSEYARAPALKLQDVDMRDLIREVVELYRINQFDAQVHIDFHDTNLPEKLHVDSDRIRQLLVNLIKNALEATENLDTDTDQQARNPALVSISTKLETMANGIFYVISVSDNGPGIDEELLPRLFEPYTSTKSKGSGLGLAIVKKIVEEHNGQVFARNKKSGGAQISVYLPVEKA